MTAVSAHVVIHPVMNLLIGLLWACATFRADAASPEANVYIYPESAEPQSRTPSISPNDARLLFALRLRVSEYHSIGDAGESTLNILNAYEGPQRPLFGNEAGDESRRLLLVVEGVEHPEGSIRRLPDRRVQVLMF